MASGDETLKFLGLHALSDTAVETTVTSGHTYTVISVTFCEMGNVDELISMYVDDASNDIYILNAQSCLLKRLGRITRNLSWKRQTNLES